MDLRRPAERARQPERALDRRNLVLRMMHENHAIADEDYTAAVGAPLGLNLGKTEFAEAQYYLDLASDEVQRRLENRETRGATNVYTSLDLRLQAAAENALRDGMRKVDLELKKRHRVRKGDKGVIDQQAQAAIIVLDPRTGEIKAL